MTTKKIVISSLVGITAVSAGLVGFNLVQNSRDKDQNRTDQSTTPTPEPTTTVAPSLTPTPTKADVTVSPTIKPSTTVRPSTTTTTQPTGKVITDFKSSSNYKYYTISGSTETEMRNQLNTLGPKDSSGETYDALASWNTKWTYKTKTSTAGCSLDSITVTTDVIITFPKWSQPSNASSTLVTKWNTYTKNLQIHEEGHRDISFQYGKKIADSFSSGLTASDCDKLKKLIDEQSMVIVKQNQQADIDYDKETDHGATQGAVFP